ncbi:MAG: hypothetical protein KA419_19040, partial [Acidobacteria bacterium]|nr:hypothetical protein [Acidobacteriota bacterium]
GAPGGMGFKEGKTAGLGGMPPAVPWGADLFRFHPPPPIVLLVAGNLLEDLIQKLAIASFCGFSGKVATPLV